MVSVAMEHDVCGSLTEILTEGTPVSVMMSVLWKVGAVLEYG